jgi:UDP-sugar transporter A1/2/3
MLPTMLKSMLAVGERIAEDGFFQGYNWAVWSTIIIQALGGIVSAF